MAVHSVSKLGLSGEILKVVLNSPETKQEFIKPENMGLRVWTLEYRTGPPRIHWIWTGLIQ